MKKMRLVLIVAALSLMLTGVAFAIDIPNISTWTQLMGVGGGLTGRGDVLLGPLYDVRALVNPQTPENRPVAGVAATQQTLIGLVNTDHNNAVVARLRFREWMRSHECLDLDIPLTSNDVWVGEVSRLAAGGAVLKSPDRWITNIPATAGDPFLAAIINATDFGLGVGGGIPFRPNQILQFEPSVPLATAIARCEYGYFEVIGEEFTSVNATKTQFTRLGVGVDRDVKDVLMGNAYLIRPEVAISHEYNLTAISDFSVRTDGIYRSPLTDLPNLLRQVQGEVNNGEALANPGVGGFFQLEAILSKRFVDFQYENGILGTTPASTSVVVTFPTKWTHYNNASPYSAVVAFPFLAPFTGVCEVEGAPASCATGGPGSGATGGGEVVNVRVWDREENTFTIPGQNPISPPSTLTPGLPKLPYEVNVIGVVPNDPPQVDFRNNTAIATANNQSLQVFNEGWGQIDLSPDLLFVTSDPRIVRQGKNPVTFNFMGTLFPTGAVPVPGVHYPFECTLIPGGCPGAYRGLPAIGIVMTEFFNDSVGQIFGIGGYFGNTVPWQYEAAFGETP